MRIPSMVFLFLFLVWESAAASPKTKFNETMQKAESGDIEAQYKLAQRYEDGDGVAKDLKEAFIWYKKSAEQGFAPAQNSLGYRYLNGQGVDRDPQSALLWYRKAAEQGYALGEFNLAVMLDAGKDIPEDNLQAAQWYEKAAKQGFSRAQLNLGAMYLNGEGVEKDLEKAWELFNHVRLTSRDNETKWGARRALDYIKHELGIDGPNGPGRFVYPNWVELQRYIKKPAQK